jgi:phosphoadenosine phosphosulfate reductase
MGEAVTPLVHRYHCCGENLMIPLFARIKADGCTLLIRGTKLADMHRLPMASGQVLEGLELLLPLLGWSNAQVLEYLRDQGAPVSTAYTHFENLPECATCPAWWTEGRAAYLRARHPALYRRYLERMSLVMDEVGPAVAALARELREIGHG